MAADELTTVQRWFHAVVTHPAGVGAGIESPAAQALARLDRSTLETMVRASSRLTAEQRLSIYANAYYARLIECVGDCFPLLKRVLGADLFDAFAFDYLQRYPSRSYTLDRLAESFPRFLEETRPDRPATDGGAPAWPDFLIDLATLELAIAKVFDGPGCEGEPLLSAADLPPAAAPAAGDVRLTPVPCLRLLRFRFPVNAFYAAARRTQPDDGLPEPPEPLASGDEFVALSRTDFVVQRHALDPLEHALLAALLAGATVGEAVAAAATATPDLAHLADDDLAARLGAAFRRFTAAGFFRAATS